MKKNGTIRHFISRLHSRHIVIVSGLLSCLFGLAVMAGLYLNAFSYIHLNPSFTSVPVNAGLCFLFSGLGIVGFLYKNSRLFYIYGPVVFVIALLTLVQYAYDIDLFIDHLLLDYSSQSQLSHPGRMSPNSAFAFLFVGAALMVINTMRLFKSGFLILGFFGSIVIAIGTTALGGYFSGLRIAYVWGNMVPISIYSAIFFVILGAGIVAHAWHIGRVQKSDIFWLIIGPIGVAIFIVAISAWQGMMINENAYMKRVVESSAESIQSQISGLVKYNITALVQMGNRWKTAASFTKDHWQNEARAIFDSQDIFQAILFVSPAQRIRWVYPQTDNENLIGFALYAEENHSATLNLASQQKDVVISPFIDLIKGGKGFIIAVPIFRNNTLEGFIVTLISDDKLKRVLQLIMPSEFLVSITDGKEELFFQRGSSAHEEKRWLVKSGIVLPGITWRIRIWPSSSLLAKERALHSRLLLFMFFLLPFACAWFIYLAFVTKVHIKDWNQSDDHLRQQDDKSHQLAALVSDSHDAIMVLDLGGKIHAWNQGAEKMYGWQEDEVLGQDITSIFTKEIAVETVIFINKLKKGEPLESLETQRVTKDGKVLEIWVNATMLTGDDGEVLGVATIERDITERKQIEENQKKLAATAAAAEIERKKSFEIQKAYQELKNTQSMLVQAEKMSAVGQLASGLAHEVKNPLAIIIQGVDYLRGQDTVMGEENLQVIDMIRDAVGRADMIVRDLLGFSRASTSNLVPGDINKVILTSLSLVEKQLVLGNIQVGKIFEKNMPNMMLDENMLTQVFINIIINAQQAMGKKGKLTLKTRLISMEELKTFIGQQESDKLKPSEKAIVCEVEDTGHGIPKEKLSKVFEPFFTTKQPGEGTGLGMSITRSIIDTHGGFIWIDSTEGVGTKISIAFPVAKGE